MPLLKLKATTRLLNEIYIPIPKVFHRNILILLRYKEFLYHSGPKEIYHKFGLDYNYQMVVNYLDYLLRITKGLESAVKQKKGKWREI